MGIDMSVSLSYSKDGEVTPITLTSGNKEVNLNALFRNGLAFEWMDKDGDLVQFERFLTTDERERICSIKNSHRKEGNELYRKERDEGGYHYGHSVYTLKQLEEMKDILWDMVERERKVQETRESSKNCILVDGETMNVEEFIEYCKTEFLPINEVIDICLKQTYFYDSDDCDLEELEGVYGCIEELYNRCYYTFILWYNMNICYWDTEQEMCLNGMDNTLVTIKFDC